MRNYEHLTTEHGQDVYIAVSDDGTYWVLERIDRRGNVQTSPHYASRDEAYTAWTNRHNQPINFR